MLPNLSDVPGDDELNQLRVLRQIVAFHIDDCDSKRDLAALALKYQNIVARISQLEPPKSERDSKSDAVAKVVNLR